LLDKIMGLLFHIPIVVLQVCDMCDHTYSRESLKCLLRSYKLHVFRCMSVQTVVSLNFLIYDVNSYKKRRKRKPQVTIY